MRSLLLIITIAFSLVLLCAAILLLASGKAFVYAPGFASARSLGSVVRWGGAAIAAGLVAAALLEAVGRALPKAYYAFQRWRDAALVVAALGALAVVVGYLGRALVYGAF
jgi:hypothetical protein